MKKSSTLLRRTISPGCAHGNMGQEVPPVQETFASSMKRTPQPPVKAGAHRERMEVGAL